MDVGADDESSSLPNRSSLPLSLPSEPNRSSAVLFVDVDVEVEVEVEVREEEFELWELRELCELCELAVDSVVTVESVPVSELEDSDAPVRLELDDDPLVDEISVVPVADEL